MWALPGRSENQWCLPPKLRSGWPVLSWAIGRSWQKGSLELGGHRNKITSKFWYRCRICFSLSDHRHFRWYPHCFLALVWLSGLKYSSYITSLGGGSVKGNRLGGTILIFKRTWPSFSEKIEVQFNWNQWTYLLSDAMLGSGFKNDWNLFFAPLALLVEGWGIGTLKES